MKNYKLGLQAHSVREAFAENPLETMKRVRAMGYTGIEIPLGSITSRNEDLSGAGADFFKKALEEADLECYGVLTAWSDVLPDKIEKTIKFNNAVGSGFLVIGSVPTSLIPDIDAVNAIIAQMKEVHELLKSRGIVTGYHNHDTDFTTVINGKTFFEHVFDNMPEDFVMLLDTGNALAAGYESIPLFNKYPGRSPYLHIKGYSKEKDYLAYIGQDDFDWAETLRTAITVGKSVVFDVEFGKRGDYDPFERAKNGYKVVSKILESL